MGVAACPASPRVIMFKLGLLLVLATSSQALNCNECINEMHGINMIIKHGAPEIMGFLKENYCPTLDGEENVQMCLSNRTEFYVEMLWMIVEHFFVDGAQHICQAWGFCDVAMDTFPYTCEECVEGLEVVGAYMTDPLWVAEYTLYLEQNFCVGHSERCVPAVKAHFPPMHAMTVEQFWKPAELCGMQEVCGATKPPQ